MDRTGSIDGAEMDRDYPVADEPAPEAPPMIGTDERRMHVRAYNYWVSLLNGRPYPAIVDLDAANVPDFGGHGVVLDFSGGAADPAILFVGGALREEGGHDRPIEHVSDVPRGSLLSRLTDHIDEIIANHAPIGFEAEFVNQRQRNMMYRGILMPFSGDGARIDAIYGVINWKEAPDDAFSARLTAELEREMAAPVPRAAAISSPVWADGPNAAPLEPLAFPATGHAPHGAAGPGDWPAADAPAAQARDILRGRTPTATLDMAVPGDDEFVLLVARRLGDGRLGILAPVTDMALLDEALARLAG